jgi:NitT/TauT family transport system substrate-binding protein
MKITCEVPYALFGLPWLVARDEGLFDEASVEVELKPGGEDQSLENIVFDPNQVNSIANHAPFANGEVQTFGACEWGQLRRTFDSAIAAKVMRKRPAVVSQAIIVHPDSRFLRLQDLSHVPIAVRFHTASHYMTLQMLEGFLPKDEIKVMYLVTKSQHASHRYKALLNRTVDAITVAEPFISLAEKHGLRILCEARYQGSEMVSTVDTEAYARATIAVKKAIALIMADKRKYVHYITAMIPPELGSLSPGEFHTARIEYVDYAPYTKEDFERAYNWMVRWNLLDKSASFEQLVNKEGA